ncbi:glycosyltransferase [Ligilactobacillus ceti]|uniref:Glycosyl transferase family 1 domain-containing protein n=1 Tax=Ligilactobacillus ceti DSM 22408 TaxID=1122146 RepID=A0A0R2KQF6_9LACO|nr:glycosyltransferase [Ligilactobacillus ceti]KRN88436.1 hypothetical protein IV53_GL000400 [Ligilactobacillus ceti DSM 22408]
MEKIGIIGHFGKNKNLLNGQTIKTKIISEGLVKRYGRENISYLDTYNSKKEFIIKIIMLIRLMRKCENIIMLPAHNGLRIFAPLMVLINKFYKRNLYYIVIGGWLPSFLEKRPKLKKDLKEFTTIYVETKIMAANLKEQGFKNIDILPNCKELKHVKGNEIQYYEKAPYKLCTFSRVMQEKGIEDAINVIININEKNNKIIYTLDIYGQVDVQQQQWFDDLMNEVPDYIQYKGMIPFDQSTQIIKKYFALLFPTKFYTEGIPGTIIDAYSAGIPVIASRWESYEDVIDENITGIGYTMNDLNDFQKKLEMIMNKPELINNLRKNALKKAKNYDITHVVDNKLNHF